MNTFSRATVAAAVATGMLSGMTPLAAAQPPLPELEAVLEPASAPTEPEAPKVAEGEKLPIYGFVPRGDGIYMPVKATTEKGNGPIERFRATWTTPDGKESELVVTEKFINESAGEKVTLDLKRDTDGSQVRADTADIYGAWLKERAAQMTSMFTIWKEALEGAEPALANPETGEAYEGVDQAKATADAELQKLKAKESEIDAMVENKNVEAIKAEYAGRIKGIDAHSLGEQRKALQEQRDKDIAAAREAAKKGDSYKFTIADLKVPGHDLKIIAEATPTGKDDEKIGEDAEKKIREVEELYNKKIEELQPDWGNRPLVIEGDNLEKVRGMKPGERSELTVRAKDGGAEEKIVIIRKGDTAPDAPPAAPPAKPANDAPPAPGAGAVEATPVDTA